MMMVTWQCETIQTASSDFEAKEASKLGNTDAAGAGVLTSTSSAFSFLLLLFNITIIIWMKLREWKFWSPAPKSTCPMASQTSNSEMLNVAGSSQSTWRRFKGELENANFCFSKGREFQLQWWVSWSPKDVVKTPRPWVEELSSFVEPWSLWPTGWLALLLGFQDR